LSEGLGTSLLDAMAASKATVATRTGGIPEVVVDGETGLLVAPRDHHEMAQAITRLLKDQALRQKMGAAGFERVQRVFSAERMVERTLEVYRLYAGRHEAADNTHPSTDNPRPLVRG
jgi:glycosyltransferase involved in cell wall biosynthesis